jgi:BirA family biotin operon repressor/biotin-[acetyl-CoA-carboxylase] ligase
MIFMKNKDTSNTLFERLDIDKILSFVSEENVCYLADLDIFDSIPSTNQFLLEQAKTSPSGYFCLAEHQTAGRGRRGRVWETPLGGNIACSLLWRFKSEQLLSGLSNTIGVIVIKALQKYGVHAGLQLKWPNDVLFSGRKLAGILLEKVGESVVIGVGINVCLSGMKVEERIDVTEIIGAPIARNKLVGLLINELLTGLPLFQKQGFNTFITDWRKHDCFVGCTVTVSTPKKTFTGIAQGINETGEFLLLDSHQQVHTFQYGEVTVRRLD